MWCFVPSQAKGRVTSGKISLKKKQQPEIFVKQAEESADGHIRAPTLLINRVPSVGYSNKENTSAGQTHSVCVCAALLHGGAKVEEGSDQSESEGEKKKKRKKKTCGSNETKKKYTTH